jgi:formamidopyrimidine-DNA glycosylase
MPELPEVETVRQQLSTSLPLTILKEEMSNVIGSLLKPQNHQFSPVGMVLREIRRKGKLMTMVFDDDHYLLSHFGMSGGWRISDKKIIEKHTHLQFKCESLTGKIHYLAFVDPRRFGHLFFFNRESAQKKWDELGVDISTPEFTYDYLKSVIKRFPEKQIKPFLLDQKFFAGVGNYIASEICARAGIRPTRRNKLIREKEIQKLLTATKIVIDGTLKTNGTTFSGGYTDASGEKGQGVGHLVVFYQETCQLCLKTPVTKIILAQRGTYYCPHCQK